MMFRNLIGCILAALVAIGYYYYNDSYVNRRSKYLDVESNDAIIVTGSSSGIGKHAALSLVQEGYTVFACVRKESDGQELIDTAKTFNLDTSLLKPLIMDVTNSQQIQDALEVVSTFVGSKGLKGLFNNAGVGGDPDVNLGTSSGAVEHRSMDEYRFVMEVNFFGLVEVTKAFLPLLRKHSNGRIIMNTSIAGIISNPFFSAYASSKYAVEAFTDSLRRELLPIGTTKAILLEPGFVQSAIYGKNMEYKADGIEPYKMKEISSWFQFWSDGQYAYHPRVTSECIIDAIRSEKPKIRYQAGHSAHLGKWISRLPAAWVDSLMLMMPEVILTKDEWNDLVKNIKMFDKFEL